MIAVREWLYNLVYGAIDQQTVSNLNILDVHISSSGKYEHFIDCIY